MKIEIFFQRILLCPMTQVTTLTSLVSAIFIEARVVAYASLRDTPKNVGNMKYIFLCTHEMILDITGYNTTVINTFRPKKKCTYEQINHKHTILVNKKNFWTFAF